MSEPKTTPDGDQNRSLRFHVFAEQHAGSPVDKPSPRIDRDYAEVEFAQLLEQNLAGATLILEPSYQCDLHCAFCPLPVHRPTTLNWPAIWPVVKALSLCGARNVVLTGGEPGLQDNLVEILGTLRKLGMRVCLLTNGCWARDAHRCEQVVTAGVDSVVLAVKGFTTKEVKALAGHESCCAMQHQALANFVALRKSGLLHTLTLEHVLTCHTLTNPTGLSSWLSRVDRCFDLTLSLMEPYQDAMTGLVPDYAELQEALPSLLNEWVGVGVTIKVEGFPLCLLGEHWKLSKDPSRMGDSGPRVWIMPKEDADHVCYYAGYQRLRQFGHVDRCVGCAMAGLCPGVHHRMATPDNKAALKPFSNQGQPQ